MRNPVSKSVWTKPEAQHAHTTHSQHSSILEMSVRATKMNTFIGNQREAIAAPDGDIYLLAFPRSWPFILFFKCNLLIFKTGPNYVFHAGLELESLRT